ncbi:MAG: DUF2085 domain-containing protein [Chloroflexi bacterium]|nr:DUF2085 domain-containing protein [Chloroflexota bacterium]MBU1746078.1 DUF2085 domain-containing protein [Chloroflexota bacterium]
MTFARAVARIFILARRIWLIPANLVALGLAILPLLAPVLMHLGLVDAANTVYGVCGLQCHQLPGRSFFLGPYPLGVCERCISIDVAVLLAGLAYARWRRPLRFRLWTPLFLLAAMIPMAIDGGSQYLGWRESTWWLRVLTGSIYGAGLVFFFYPLLDLLLTRALVEFARAGILEPHEVALQ